MLSARGRGLAATNGCAIRIFVILFVLVFDDVEFVAQMMAQIAARRGVDIERVGGAGKDDDL